MGGFVPRIYDTRNITVASSDTGGSVIGADDAGAVHDLDAADWGPFLPLRAWRVIKGKLTGLPQHIAWALASITPRDGKLFVSNRKLADVTGHSESTAGRAMREIEKAGLIMRRQGRDGWHVTWGKSAYLAPDVAGPHAKP